MGILEGIGEGIGGLFHDHINIAKHHPKVYRHFTRPLTELIQDQNPNATVKALQQQCQRWNAERQADAIKTNTTFDLSASNVPVRVGDVVLLTKGTTNDINDRECFRQTPDGSPLSSPYYYKDDYYKCDAWYETPSGAECIDFKAGDYTAACLYVVVAVPERYWGPGGNDNVMQTPRVGDIAMPNPGDPYEKKELTCGDTKRFTVSRVQDRPMNGGGGMGKYCAEPSALECIEANPGDFNAACSVCSFVGQKGWQNEGVLVEDSSSINCFNDLNSSGKRKYAKGKYKYNSVGLVPLLGSDGTPNYDLLTNKLTTSSSAALTAILNGPADAVPGLAMVVNKDDPKWGGRGHAQPIGKAAGHVAWAAAKAGATNGWFDAGQLSFLHADGDKEGPCCYGDAVRLRLGSGTVKRGGDIYATTAELNSAWAKPDLRSQFYGGRAGPFSSKEPYPMTGQEWATADYTLSFVHIGELFPMVKNDRYASQQRVARKVLACVLDKANAERDECKELMRTTTNGCSETSVGKVQCIQPTAAGNVDVRTAVVDFCKTDDRMSTTFCQLASNIFVNKQFFRGMDLVVAKYCRRNVRLAKGDLSKMDPFCGCFREYIEETPGYKALVNGPLRRYKDQVMNMKPSCMWKSCNVGVVSAIGKASPYEFVQQMKMRCTPLTLCVNEVDVKSQKVIMDDLNLKNNCKSTIDNEPDAKPDATAKPDAKPVDIEARPPSMAVSLAIGAVLLVVVIALLFVRHKLENTAKPSGATAGSPPLG